jgi:hypothetical protein
MRVVHAITPIVTQRTTWSVPSPKRSVAKALKYTTFCQSGGAVPSIVGSRYMFGSQSYCCW